MRSRIIEKINNYSLLGLVGGLILILLLNLILINLLGTITGLGSSDSAIASVSSTMAVYGTTLLWIATRLYSSGVSFRNFFGKYPTLFSIVKMVPIVVCLLLFSYGVTALSFYLLSFISPDFVLTQLGALAEEVSSASFLQRVFSSFDTVTIIILAPVVEELFFRGFLLPKLTSRSGLIAGVLFSSILFGIFHFDLVGSTVFAIVMSILAIRSKGLWLPISMHILNNAIAHLMPDGGESSTEVFQLSDLYSEVPRAILFLLISTPVILFFIYRSWPKKTDVDGYLNRLDS